MVIVGILNSDVYFSYIYIFSRTNFRVNQVFINLHMGHCQRGIMCSSVYLQSQKGISKLYMIPVRHFRWEPFVTLSSVETGRNPQKYRASSVPTLQDSERSETLLGSSSSTFDGMSDFEIQLQELFNEVKMMIKTGNENDAVDLLQANYEAVKEQIEAGARGIEVVALLDIIALGYMALGDLNIVDSVLDTMDGLLDHIKDGEPLLDSILIHVASMYSTLGNFKKSILLYQRVTEIWECKYGKNSAFLLTSLLGMAKALGSAGRVTKAVETYNRSIIILETSRGAESEDLVVPLFGLGNLLIKEGRAAEAESIFVRVLKIYSKLYGDTDGRVGMVMCSLARAKCAKGNAVEAIDLYKRALQVIKDANYMALDDSIMENMRIELAELLHVVGRGKEGRELLEECLFITEKYKGKEHPSSVTHLLNLSASCSRAKNFVEAERLLRTALEIMMKAVGPEDQSITFPMLDLAVTLYQLNRDEEAEELALKALHIREKAFGKDSLPVGEALDCLASIQVRLGRDNTDLLDLLNRILRIQERELGFESEEIIVTLQKILVYLDKLGRKNETFALQRRLSLLTRKYQQAIRY